MADFGIDAAIVRDEDGAPDIGWDQEVSGPTAVLQEVATRWTTDLVFYAPGEGVNLLALANSDPSRGDLYQASVILDRQARAVPGVDDIRVQLTTDRRVLTVDAVATIEGRTYPIELEVSAGGALRVILDGVDTEVIA